VRFTLKETPTAARSIRPPYRECLDVKQWSKCRHNGAKKGGALYSEFPDTAYIFLATTFVGYVKCIGNNVALKRVNPTGTASFLFDNFFATWLFHPWDISFREGGRE